MSFLVATDICLRKNFEHVLRKTEEQKVNDSYTQITKEVWPALSTKPSSNYQKNVGGKVDIFEEYTNTKVRKFIKVNFKIPFVYHLEVPYIIPYSEVEDRIHNTKS